MQITFGHPVDRLPKTPVWTPSCRNRNCDAKIFFISTQIYWSLIYFHFLWHTLGNMFNCVWTCAFKIISAQTSSPPVISKSNPPKSADKGKEGKVPHLSPGFGSLRVSGQKLDWTPTVLEVRGLAPSPPPPFADQLCQVTPCVTLL